MSFTLAGVTDTVSATFTRQAELNIVEWLRHALLLAGSYVRVDGTTPTIPAGAVAPTTLVKTDTPGWPTGRVYATRRADWVWEPTVTSVPNTVVVRVDAVVQDPSTYTVYWPKGWVVFDSAPADGAVVTADHSYRYHRVHDSYSPFARRLDTLSLTMNDPRAVNPSGGELAVAADDRVQLPAVIVGAAGNFRATSYELGSARFEASTDFVLTCAGEMKEDVIWMCDALCAQLDTAIPTFDANAAPPPLDRDGALVVSPLNFPALCGAHPWRPLTVINALSGPVDRFGGIWWGAVRWTVRLGVLGGAAG